VGSCWFSLLPGFLPLSCILSLTAIEAPIGALQDKPLTLAQRSHAHYPHVLYSLILARFAVVQHSPPQVRRAERLSLRTCLKRGKEMEWTREKRSCENRVVVAGDLTRQCAIIFESRSHGVLPVSGFSCVVLSGRTRSGRAGDWVFTSCLLVTFPAVRRSPLWVFGAREAPCGAHTRHAPPGNPRKAAVLPERPTSVRRIRLKV
jgi:hypothetical protein